MTKDEIGCILILLTILAIPIWFVWCIYDCVKKSRAEDAAYKIEAEAAAKKLEEEMLKPKYRIRFIDHAFMEHVTKPFNPYLTTNMFERAEGEKISVISSERYAKKFLPRAYEIGFLRDETGVTFPMCNLHKAFVEEAK
jgi:hypothetical protein